MAERSFKRQLCTAWIFVRGDKWRCRRPQYHFGDCQFRGDSTHNDVGVLADADLLTIDQITERAHA